MSSSRVLILMVLGGMGLGAGARVWRGHADVEQAGKAGSVEDSAAVIGFSGSSPAVGQAVAEGEMARRGESDSPDSVEGILAAEGFEQAERLGRFLPSAEPEELERLWRGLREQRAFLEETLGDAIFLRWMTIDPAGGLDFAGKELPGSSAWWAWGKVDPEAALAAALKQKEPGSGSAVVRAIAQSDPARARELLDRYPQFRDSNAMSGLAAGLTRSDPAAGATVAAAWNHQINHENHLSTWASRDPEAALAWAHTLPDQTRRSEALGVLITQWAGTNPEKIAPAIDALPEGRTKWNLYAEHASRLAATDPAAARAWVEAAPTPRVRDEALVQLARGLAASDPAAALETLGAVAWEQRGDAGYSQTVYRSEGTVTSGGDPARNALEGIAAVAPEQAMTFAARLPPEANAVGLSLQVFDSWMRQDSMAASEWLADQPAGEIKDSATTALVRDLMQGVEADYDAAFRWALTLPKTHDEAGLARNVLIRWGTRDKEAARAALENPAVPPDLRAFMAKQLSKQLARP